VVKPANLTYCYVAKLAQNQEKRKAIFSLKTKSSQFQAEALEKHEGNRVMQKNGNPCMSSRTCSEPAVCPRKGPGKAPFQT